MMRVVSRLSVLLLSFTALSQVAEAKDLTEKDVKAVLSRHYPEVKNCYLQHAEKQQSAQGNVVVQVVVGKNGQVTDGSATVEAPGVTGKQFANCVKRSTAAWRFPTISNPTEVRYPLLFIKTRARGAGPKPGKSTTSES
jgi:hypothetical protein